MDETNSIAAAWPWSFVSPSPPFPGSPTIPAAWYHWDLVPYFLVSKTPPWPLLWGRTVSWGVRRLAVKARKVKRPCRGYDERENKQRAKEKDSRRDKGMS
jgi:hypothetical protein